MPNGSTALERALQISGQGFNQKLSAVMGVFQSLKQAQVEKQKTRQQLEAQKDLIQFRSDVSFEQQKRAYEEIEKPQIEAKQQQELLEAQRESFREATQATKELANKFSQATYRNISKYNLLDPTFEVESVETGDGQVQGYRPSIKVNGNEVAQPEFVEELRRRANFGDFINQVEQKADDGELALSTTKQVDINGESYNFSTIGEDNVGDFVGQIKQDPQFREAMFQIWNRSGESALISKKDPDAEGEEGGGRKTPLTDLVPQIGRIKGQLQNGTKNYKFIEDVGLFGQDKATEFNIDFDTTIGDVQNQVNKAIGATFFDDPVEFDLGNIPQEARKAIVAGNVEALENNLEGNVKDWAVSLAEKTGTTKQQIDELIKIHDFYTYAYNEGFRVSQGVDADGTLPSPHEVILDLQNVPSDLSNVSNFRQMFVDIDKTGDRFTRAGNKARLNMFSESFRQETAPALGIFGGGQTKGIKK